MQQSKRDPVLFIIRGLPGSGKSTIARELLAGYDDTARHFEADQYFIDKDGVYAFDGSKIGQAHEWCLESTVRALAEGRTVFVSNTFTKIAELQPYFDAIQLYDRNPTVLCMQNRFGSIHAVPDAVMLNMQKRFAHDISHLFKDF